MTEIKYYIDGTDLSTLGLRVSGSRGVIDAPKFKKPYSVNAEFLHGEYVDLSEIYYEPKSITLESFLSASSNAGLISSLNSLKELLYTPGLKRLMIVADPDKPLVYDIYCKDGFEIDKKWRTSGEVAGKLSLKLTEPEPFKQVLKYTGSGLQLGLNNTLVNVSWGDGTFSRAIESMSAPHVFSTSGTYYVIITGTNIRTLNITTGGATVLWQILL